eukprot:4480640-Amphidinium_carterae.1
MSTRTVLANDDPVRLPLDMDCAVAPIVSSGCSPFVSIGSVVDAPGCPAALVGTVSGGDAGLAAVDGL